MFSSSAYQMVRILMFRLQAPRHGWVHPTARPLLFRVTNMRSTSRGRGSLVLAHPTAPDAPSFLLVAPPAVFLGAYACLVIHATHCLTARSPCSPSGTHSNISNHERIDGTQRSKSVSPNQVRQIGHLFILSSDAQCVQHTMCPHTNVVSRIRCMQIIHRTAH